MPSFASEMPESPGAIPTDALYKRPYRNKYDEQEEQITSMQEENMRLKANLTRVRNEYEELRDESNYQRVKVSELSELVKSSTSPPSSSFPKSQYTPVAYPSEMTDSFVHESLIEKSLQNAELTLAHDKLKIELHNAESRLKNLEVQRKANNKLLLEMGDVIRTLNAVNIEYAVYTSEGEIMTAQQQSIKNIKFKVEAILQHRDILMEKCQELDELTKCQGKKVLALEAQFHIVNSVNISQGVSLGEIAVHTNMAPALSVAGSTLTDDIMSQQSTVVSTQPTVSTGARNRKTDAAAEEIVRQGRELARYKRQEEEFYKEVSDLNNSQRTSKDTISRLQFENNQLTAELNSVTMSLMTTKGLMEDAIVKRDEFKENLVDIIGHYKELQTDHESSNDKISELESMVVKLQSKARETRAKQALLEKTARLERERRRALELVHPSDKEEHACKMDDLLVAYAKAQKEIQSLQESLMKKELGKGSNDVITKFKKMERERNDFQRKLDKALEDTRLAKQQVQKEKEDSKQVRRQLKALMQHRDDETASLDSDSGQRSNASSRSRSSVKSQSVRSRSSSQRKALVKKASFKPLTVEELMTKDFA